MTKEYLDEIYNKYRKSHFISGDPNGKTFASRLISVIPIEHSRESFEEAIKTYPEFAEEWIPKSELVKIRFEQNK